MTWKYEMHSILASLIYQFILEKRVMGFKYELNEYYLHLFDEYCIINKLKNILDITRDFLSGWLEQKPTEGLAQMAGRISIVRQFLLYLLGLGIPVYIPTESIRTDRRMPHILTKEESEALFAAIDAYNPPPPFYRFANEYKVIFRLIFSTGLRNGEACSVILEDFKLAEGTLLIRDDKKHRDRLIYLADDTCALLASYRDYIRRTLGGLPYWLFPAKDISDHINKTLVDRQFSEAWDKTPFADKVNDRPVVHDLRYTFVTRRINQWISEGKDLNVMLPYLVKHLGHSDFSSTYYYYHLSDDTRSIIDKYDRTGMAALDSMNRGE